MSQRTWILFGLVAVVAGTPYLFVKVAVEELSPAVVVCGRLVIGAALLSPLLLRRGVARSLWHHRGAVIPFGIMDPVVPFLLVAIAEQSVDSGTAGVLISSTPIWVALLAIWWDQSERAGRRRQVGLALGLVGVVVLLAPHPAQAGDDAATVLVVLAALSFACASLFFKRRCEGIEPAHAIAGTLLFGSVLLAPLAILAWPSSQPSASALAAVAVLGVVCTAGALVAFYALVGAIGAGRATVTAYAAPMVSVLAGVTILSEPLRPAMVVGMVSIIAGSLLATTRSEVVPLEPM